MTTSPQRNVDRTAEQRPDDGAASSTICPFCAALRPAVETELCPRCRLPDTPATRTATSARLGPWFVFQRRNPAAPGMNWATLRELIEQGRVKPRSVVRGPSTGQLWVQASKARGVSRLFGKCWSCGADITPSTEVCPHCQAEQLPPGDPDALLVQGTLRRRTVAKVPGTWAAGSDAPLRHSIDAPVPAPFEQDDRGRPRRGRKRRVLAAIVLLMLIGVGGFVAYDPDAAAGLWERARDYDWSGAWADVKAAVAGQPKSKGE